MRAATVLVAAPVNVVTTASGLVRPVCEDCGKRGRAVRPRADGTVSMWSLARGWWVAPYPLTFVHTDGSTGDKFTCSACSRVQAGGGHR
jgi:hypothetical protein